MRNSKRRREETPAPIEVRIRGQAYWYKDRAFDGWKSLHDAVRIFSGASDQFLHGIQIARAEVLNGLRYAAAQLVSEESGSHILCGRFRLTPESLTTEQMPSGPGTG
jgi:hypothetical protein